MKTRIDQLREEQKNVEIFSDFMTSFEAHPVTGKLIKLKNDDSLKQAISNKVKTIFGERYCLPNEGTNVNNSLFEPNDNFLKESISNSIRNAFQNNERMSIQSISTEIDDVQINIILNVRIIGNNTLLEVPVIIRRVR